MKGITSRLQVFLAKIAGKEVDVSTLTPPVAINEEEKLMLDIADRIAAIEEGGGGGGGVLWCNYSGDDETGYKIDKSYNEIKAAIDNGVMPVMVKDESSSFAEEQPSATEIWDKVYFYISGVISYLNSDSAPRYEAYFDNGSFSFASNDPDADMVEV